MKQAGINQTELAHRTGISCSQISNLVNSRRLAGLETLLKILDACGLEVIELRVKKTFHREMPHLLPAANRLH